jgi:CRISPR-associated protein Csm2
LDRFINKKKGEITMAEYIPELIKEMENIEGRIRQLSSEIQELKKQEEESRDKEKKKALTVKIEQLKNEKNSAQKEVQTIWNMILNRIPSFIKGENQKEMIESCREFGRRFKNNNLTTSQIRNVYGEVKKIQMKSSMLKEDENIDILPLRMLLPKLAYSAARAKKKGTDELKDILSKGIETVLENETDSKEVLKRFEMFSNFFEAILAYHKAEGGN